MVVGEGVEVAVLDEAKEGMVAVAGAGECVGFIVSCR
jgi:hypothetical protein